MSKTLTPNQKKFLSSPSKLSTGKTNLRFKGSIYSHSIMQRASQQSNRDMGYSED